MVDVAAHVRPDRAAPLGRALRRLGLEPGRLRAGDRAPPVEHGPTRPCRRWSRCWRRSSRAAGASRCTRAPGRRSSGAGLLERAERGGDPRPAARLPRLHRAAGLGRGLPDRLRRRAEGGLPAPRALPHAARHQRVGGDDRAGLEPAGRRWTRPRSAAALADLSRPGEHPPLYGDGHAAERIAELVAAFRGDACTSRAMSHRHRDHRRRLRRPAARRRVRRGGQARRLRRHRPRQGGGDRARRRATSSDVPSARAGAAGGGRPLTATTDYAAVRRGGRDPDLRAHAAVRATASRTSRSSSAARRAIAPHLRRRPAGGARVDHLPRHHPRACWRRSWSAAAAAPARDFHLAMSPERIDPGRTDHTVRTTPKVVGGLTPACTRARAASCTRPAWTRWCRSSSPDAAELVKLLENIFRSVNIALVNELAMLCDRMGLDVWEVIDAAATKPYGFMRFTPGPGAGRPLHPDRPLLPGLAGAPVRLPDRVHRAGRQGQHQHALLLRRARLARAERACASRWPAAACWCWACPTSRTWATSASRRRSS